LNHLRSYGREAVVTFFSDHSTVKSGFSLKYEFIAASTCGSAKVMTVASTFSDGFPPTRDVLPFNLNCDWSVQAPAGKVAVLQFVSHGIPCNGGMGVSVYNDLTQTHAMQSNVCGANKALLPKTEIISYTGQLGLKLLTGEAGGGSGFVATTKFLPSCPFSGSTLTNAGTITPRSDSPGYGNNMRCQWTIQAPEGSVILIHIEQLDLETNSDLLTIFDVSNQKQFLTGSRRSAKSTKEYLNHLRSYGREAVVTFFSDHSTVKSGFSLKYVFLALPFSSCVLSEWSPWSPCDLACSKRRTKFITDPAFGVGSCWQADDPERLQTESCSGDSCEPRDCLLSQWGDWSTCDEACVKSRDRAVLEPARGSGSCAVDLRHDTVGCSGGDCRLASTGPCHFSPAGGRAGSLTSTVYGSCVPSLKCVQTGRSFVRNRCPRRDHGANVCCYTPKRK
jgi:hypothetical protein